MYCQKLEKKHFKKELAMANKKNMSFKIAHECYIRNKLYTAKNVSAKDPYHLTGKCRDSTQVNCSVSLRLTNKICISEL